MLTSYVEEYPGVSIIHINGIMVCEHLQNVEQMWNAELEKRPEVLAFELKGVLDIDSITINRLFKMAKKASELDVKVIVYNTNEQLLDVFEIVKLTRIITVMGHEKFQKEYIQPGSSYPSPRQQ